MDPSEPKQASGPEETAANGNPPEGPPTDGTAPPPGPLSPGPVAARPKRLLTPYDAVLALVLMVAWLIPITWVGATKRDAPVLPDWLNHQHRISCLFINEVKGWQTYRLEVQKGGSGRWEEMSEENYFELPVFGYRSRLHRVLGHSYKRGKGGQRLREVGEYIKARYDQLNPEGPSLDALRFVRIYMTNEMLAKQSGRFKPMDPSEVPYNYVLYFGEMRFDGKRATYPGWGKNPPRPGAPPAASPAAAPRAAAPRATGADTASAAPTAPSAPAVTTTPPPTGEEGDL